MDPFDPRDLRASDPDRERIADILRDAASEGRLEPDELGERLDQTYQAKTFRDLEALVADLPTDTPLPSPAAAAGPAQVQGELTLTAMLSDVKRSGSWTVPPRITVSPAMGNVKLDFREARCPHRVVEIEVKGGTGNLVLIPPPGWVVDVDDLRSGWGTIKNKRGGDPAPDGVLIRVTGGIGMGTLVARNAYFYEKG
ncbi:DUF1707 domain-containing protein [Mumia sp. ZJ430]|uniref:DUF1707 SHOCT-like domain-containing protein n=1 Tax=Mumia sp. ZJ430 TaxID=2708083 RepID=UPI00141FDC7A|nr:DUF1707 domain-containing protein [Mumia sp. ZJ430]